MLGEGNNETKEQLKNDSILNIVAHSIVNKFDTLYEHIDELKKKASNEHELNQITHMEDRVDSLAQKTLSQSQDLTKTTQRNNV
jgi:alcohol dehydrogenase class IV